MKELFGIFHSKKSKNDKNFYKLIEKEYNECNELGEKRMNLANESYFIVENEIKRINMAIEKLKFEKENLESNHFSYSNYIFNQNSDEIYNLENHINSKRRSKGKKLLNTIDLSPNSISKKNKNKNIKLLKNKRKKSNENIANNEQQNNFLNNKEYGWEDITYKELDGKIGPKEPVYCYCNYISYGNMIKCDNPSCKREWFHFHCVGLKNQPKGKWFCSEKCAKEYMKKFHIKIKEISSSKKLNK